MELPQLNFPKFSFKIKDQKIFDPIRQKYVTLTPEEWVRQHTIQLFLSLEYPPHMLGVEKQIDVFGTKKRPDIIIFGKNFKPLIIAECKQPQVKLSQNTIYQTIRYFAGIGGKYLFLTNGQKHLFCKIVENKCNFQNFIPKYSEL